MSNSRALHTMQWAAAASGKTAPAATPTEQVEEAEETPKGAPVGLPTKILPIRGKDRVFAIPRLTRDENTAALWRSAQEFSRGNLPSQGRGRGGGGWMPPSSR